MKEQGLNKLPYYGSENSFSGSFHFIKTLSLFYLSRIEIISYFCIS